MRCVLSQAVDPLRHALSSIAAGRCAQCDPCPPQAPTTTLMAAYIPAAGAVTAGTAKVTDRSWHTTSKAPDKLTITHINDAVYSNNNGQWEVILRSVLFIHTLLFRRGTSSAKHTHHSHWSRLATKLTSTYFRMCILVVFPLPGTLALASGARYTGQWVADQWSGQGTFQSADGSL